MNEENNWGNWVTLGCLASFHFFDDITSLKEYSKKINVKIDKSIAGDGSMPHKVKRGKQGLWYTYFSVAPSTVSCQIIQNALWKS